MMEKINDKHALAGVEARFGFQVAARLTQDSEQLPRDVAERLKGIREMVVDRQRMGATHARHAAAVIGGAGPVAVLGGGEGSSWRLRLGLLLAVPALALGLYALQHFQREKFVSHVADIDTALLLDDVPPQAYADPGFTRYLQQGG